MKIITYSNVGYNHPSQANWSYGIWKIDLIDTNDGYCMSHTIKESFGGADRLTLKVANDLKVKMIQTKGVYPTPKITGVSKMLDIESEELFNIIKDFLTK